MKKLNTTAVLLALLLLSSAPAFAIWGRKSGYEQVPQGDQISRLAQQYATKFNITDDDDKLFLNTVAETTNIALPDETFDTVNNFQAFLAASQIAQQRNKRVIAQQIQNKMQEKFTTGSRYQ